MLSHIICKGDSGESTEARAEGLQFTPPPPAGAAPCPALAVVHRETYIETQERNTEKHKDKESGHRLLIVIGNHHARRFRRSISASGGNACARRPVTLAAVSRRPARRRAKEEGRRQKRRGIREERLTHTQHKLCRHIAAESRHTYREEEVERRDRQHMAVMLLPAMCNAICFFVSCLLHFS